MSAVVEVQYATAIAAVPSEASIEGWVLSALERPEEVEVSVRIVDTAESAQLNATYRRKQGPTNVLAFAADAAPLAGVRLLGDIVVCAPLVIAQARDQRKTAEAHWAHLVIHGTLHLQGYNHENDADAARMEGREVDILAGLGYSNPYQADDSAADERGTGSPQ